ncbi:MAG: MFS transporter, partial [Bacillota bacterium]
LHEEMGYPVLVASKFLALVQLGGVIGRISWGAISDTLFGSSRKPVLLLVGLLAATLALMMLLVTPKTPSWWIAAIVFLLGFTAIGWNGLFVALIAELAGGPANAATAIGLGMNTNQIGKVLLPPLFGLLVDTTGSYRLSWIFLSALGFAGVIFVSRVRERKTGGKRAACPGIQHSPGM